MHTIRTTTLPLTTDSPAHVTIPGLPILMQLGRIYIHTYTHTYTRTYTHTYTHTPTHIPTHTHLHILFYCHPELDSGSHLTSSPFFTK